MLFLNLQAEKNQQLIFDLDEIIFNESLTIGQKHARFLRLWAIHKELLDKLTEIFQRVQQFNFLVRFNYFLNFSFVKNEFQRLFFWLSKHAGLMFNLKEIFFNNSLTVSQKDSEFLKLRAFHEQLLYELLDFLISFSREFSD